jgi:nucleolar MIF4G domain-containing protein 1
LKSILKRTTQENNVRPLDQPTHPPNLPPRVSRSVKNKLAEDNAEIAALEKKLGLKKKRKSTNSEDDGLDDLLGDLDSGNESSEGSHSKRKRPVDDEWLARKRQKALGDAAETTEFSDSESALEDGSDLEDAEVESKDGLEDMDDEPMEEFDDLESEELEEPEEPEEPVKPRVRENPYVAPVSSSSLPIAKYIPPSLRAPPSSDEESLLRLRRLIQGLLNRLSEANLLSILRDVEQLYQTNPRGYVSSTLIDLLLGLLSDETSLMDTFLILHAGFITATYRVIGTDFGAQIVERIVSEFDRNYENEQTTGSGSKRASNLMSLVAELYNFQVIGSNLIFDYIQVFLEELSDLNTELLLRITKSTPPLTIMRYRTD